MPWVRKFQFFSIFLESAIQFFSITGIWKASCAPAGLPSPFHSYTTPKTPHRPPPHKQLIELSRAELHFYFVHTLKMCVRIFSSTHKYKCIEKKQKMANFFSCCITLYDNESNRYPLKCALFCNLLFCVWDEERRAEKSAFAEKRWNLGRKFFWMRQMHLVKA